MDFMVHQALLRNNLFLILFCIAFFSCNNAPVAIKPAHSLSNKKVNKAQAVDFKIINGILMEGNYPFNGKLFTLFPKTNDTAELASYYNGSTW